MPYELDARGLICPLPVLRARKILQGLPPEAVLCVLVTDKAAPKDFALFCTEAGHVLQSVTPRPDMPEHVIEVVVVRGPM